MSYDVLIRGGTIVVPTGALAGDIAISHGRIAALLAPGEPADALQTIDAAGKHVLPGVIDVHSHHREPGFTHKEDIITATSACAAGGITTSFAMPNVDPPPNTAANLSAMLELYRQRSIIDYNVNAAGTVVEEIDQLAEMGIAAFKVFMVVDTGRSYPHMPGIGVHDHGRLLDIFERVAATGLPLMVHPHDQALMDHIEQRAWAQGERDYRAYARAYAAYDGVIWDTAAAFLLRLQAAVGTRLHLLHTQTRGVIKLIREAKADGRAVTAEVNPWAIFLGHEWANIERLGSYALSYWVPDVNVRPIWQAMRDGTIDIFSSDHAPHTREEKEPGWTDGWKAHTGTPSAQFYLPLLLDAVNRGQITLERVTALTATGPAHAFGLRDKGRIEVGSEADLVLIDLAHEFEITDDLVLSKIGWTPYAGRRIQGSVDRTLVRGHVVYEEGRVIGQPGFGRQASPRPSMSSATAAVEG